MIHIRRPRKPPTPLGTKGKKRRAEFCKQYSADPDAYREGVRKFRFLRTIYASRQVKAALLRAQHGKCAFCESKLTHVSYGDVEHFRPKGAIRQAEGGEKLLPGYYWLAYEWSNLFLSCQICNQRFKKELFPLADPSRRARSHNDSTQAEGPLLIDPAKDAPETMISFRNEQAYAVGDSPRGSATIECLGLNRAPLLEQRLGRLRSLRSLHGIVAVARRYPADRQLAGCAADAERQLVASRKEEAEYAGMARANFAAS